MKVSNFVEDEPIEGLDYLTKPEQEIEYFYEDIVEEEPWAPQQENFTPETETYYVTDGEYRHLRRSETYFFPVRFSAPLSQSYGSSTPSSE